MRYLQFGVNGSGTRVLSDVANTSTTYGYGSGSPVVTSNDDDPASAVIWEVDSTGGQGALQAFTAAPTSTCTSSAPCTMARIWSAPIGKASKFTVPATDGGRVYVGTRDGNVFGFGSPDMVPLTGSPANFGTVAVGGKAKTQIVTMRAPLPSTSPACLSQHRRARPSGSMRSASMAPARRGLGATSVLAFTGSTGGKTDMHLVRDIAISAAS